MRCGGAASDAGIVLTMAILTMAGRAAWPGVPSRRTTSRLASAIVSIAMVSLAIVSIAIVSSATSRLANAIVSIAMVSVAIVSREGWWWG